MSRWFPRWLFLLVLCVAALCVGLYLASLRGGDFWGSGTKYVNLQLVRGVTLVFLALAAATLISAGQVDISSGAIIGACGMAVLYLSHARDGTMSLMFILAVVLALLMLLYFLYTLAAVRHMHPLITTLAMVFMLRGLSELVNVGAQGVGGVEWLKLDGLTGPLASLSRQHADAASSLALLTTSWLYVAIMLLAVAGLCHWRYRSHFGLRHIALGENAFAASRAGGQRVPVLLMAFGIAGLLVGLGWLNEFFVVRNMNWSVQDGRGYELLAIAIAVIGGTRIEGGRFDPVSVALAAMFVSLAEGAVKQTALPSETSYLVVGAVFMLAILWDSKERLEVVNRARASVTTAHE